MRGRVFLIIVFLVSMGLLIAIGLRDRLEGQGLARGLPVPDGDREIAWFHTSTNGATWEHFVAGVQRTSRQMANLEIDDARAFLESSTAIPEVVISWKNKPGKLHVRWYKVSSETSARQWVDALAQRDPAPLAIIGGGSSDRARDLARDLENRADWKGPRPLLFITTATANEVDLDGNKEYRKLTQVYPERSFRFCFTNEQMARAVVDFVWHTPDLRPRGGPPDEKGETPPPTIFPVYWEDDPYSVDLSEKFRRAVSEKTMNRQDQPFISHPPYSVGAFDRVNKVEAEYVGYILAEMPMLAGQHSLLILPTSTTPARRFLRALTGESPLIGRRLVALTGDSISINDVYQDGALLWNIRDVPVPLVFFTHQNPIDWDDDLPPPAGTDDVLLFADLVKAVLVSLRPADGDLVRDADELLVNLRAQSLIHFDADGNRQEGEEYVVCVRPAISAQGRIGAQATLEVWHRLLGGAWQQVTAGEPLQVPYSNRSAHRLLSNRS